MLVLEHVREALQADQDAAVDRGWSVEQGVAWRPWARTARLVDRVPGQRFRGEFSGTLDLGYMRNDGRLVVADWKFGEGTARLGDAAADHPQLWTLALGFATALGHTGAVRIEVRHVSEEGVWVDGADLTAGDLAAWARELEVLAAKINAGQAALPRRSHACGRCSARAACPSWEELGLAVRAELITSEPGVLMKPPKTPQDVRLLSDAIEVAERWLEQAKGWRRGYVLTHPPVPVGLGLELAAVERKSRAVLTTPEALATVERVAGGGAIVEEVRRKVTVASIRAAARGAVGEDIKSASDRKRAKDAEETRVFAELVAAGAVCEKGSVYAVGLRRSDGAVEVLDRVEEGEEVE